MSDNGKDLFESAYNMCLAFINRGEDGACAINKTIEIFMHLVEDVSSLREYLYESISFSSNEIFKSLLSEEKRDKDWWNKYRQNNEPGQYWSRYKEYLRKFKKWDMKTIEASINAPTDFVMNAISNPHSVNPEYSRGTVFGYVQSGKTANYIGLINKAIDAGYKIIIVLAGMHNNLRSQTQMRIDEEVLGFETSIAYLKGKSSDYSRIGVGSINSRIKTIIEPLTSRDEKGDYSKNRAGVNMSFQTPKIIIAKKQKSVLENIFDNFSANHAAITDPDTGNKYFSCDYPLLIIDDEADQASINTKYKNGKNGKISDDYDVSKINELIRRLLMLFKCKSYVGYTATPYANIFISTNVNDNELGEDLFPKDFIISLPKPKGYVGAMEFFGEDENSEIMPLHRSIDISLDDLWDNENKQVIVPIPDELKRAILSFLIATATRNARGQRFAPNSMLIHINRYIDTQKDIYGMVLDYYNEVESYINGGDNEIISILQQIWLDDFVPTTEKMQQNFSEYMKDVSECTWYDVLSEVKQLTENHRIHVRQINGKSEDTLSYKEYRDNGRQFNVIAIGGDKLSRGLTLEGLTISFFMRSAKIYDTLMQMGRWFGFRTGYVDLCRLYVSDYLFRCFMDVSFATENLRDQISYMNEYEKCPMEFGLRVASHPEMLISSANKIKTGSEQILTFNNVLCQTRIFDINADVYNRNFYAVEKLISKLNVPNLDHWDKLSRESTVKHLFWDDVPGNYVADFFAEYVTADKASKVNSYCISEYIKDQMQFGGVKKWTVCLKNVGDNVPITVGGYQIGSGIKRTSNQYVIANGVCSIKSLKSKDEEYYDFNAETKAKADDLLKNCKTAEYVRRELRTRDAGLLILCPLDTNEIKGLAIDNCDYKTPFGFIVIFPDNEGKGRNRSYRINDIAIESGEFID